MTSIAFSIAALLYAATVQRRTLALGFAVLAGWLVRGGLWG